MFEMMMAMLVAIAALNLWATWLVFGDNLASWGQRLAQFAFVWLVPVIGALITLHLKRKEPERGSGTYREIPDAGDDHGYPGTVARRSREDSVQASSHDDPA